MSSKFWFLTKDSLLKKIKNKTFIIVNILLLILAVALCNIDSIINYFGGDFNKTNNIMVYDETNESYNLLEDSFKLNTQILSNLKETKYKMTKVYDLEEAKNSIKKDNDILIVLKLDNGELKSQLVTYGYIDKSLYELIESSINNVNKSLVIKQMNIPASTLNKLNQKVDLKRIFVDKNKNEVEENNEFIMNVIYPIVILPFFMLTVLIIQMIGAEINEEKSTRGMEIIISNVSAKVHFFSKVLSANTFVFMQSILFLLYGFIGIKIRGQNLNVSTNAIIDGVINSNKVFDSLIEVLPFVVIIMILTILCYSILAGILASVTTNMEDFQQMQTPIVIISLVGFYLSLMNSMFDGALFIRILSYVPFISAILSPCLYLSGVIEMKDMILSILLMIVTLYLLIKYGLKVYREGILNYSSNNLWKKIFKAIKD